jgi:hypothetical protein
MMASAPSWAAADAAAEHSLFDHRAGAPVAGYAIDLNESLPRSGGEGRR